MGLTVLTAVAVLSFGLPTIASAQQITREVSPTFHGPASGTWFVNHYDSRYRYTCRTHLSDDETWALWTWNNVEAGDSRIEVYIPREEATANVTYILTMPSAGERRITVNQAAHKGQWHTLHQASHAAGRIQLRLGDANTSSSGPNNWCAWGGHHSIGAAEARLTTTVQDPEPSPNDELSDFKRCVEGKLGELRSRLYLWNEFRQLESALLDIPGLIFGLVPIVGTLYTLGKNLWTEYGSPLEKKLSEEIDNLQLGRFGCP